MEDRVDDGEILYRRVIFDSRNFSEDVSGGLLVTASAFNDPKMEPSVDRSHLCGNDPTWTQKEDKRNGVVALVASEIRGIADVQKGTAENPEILYEIDVVPDPIVTFEEKNPAHAKVRPHPSITSDPVFRRLRTSLARLVNTRSSWLIRPAGY